MPRKMVRAADVSPEKAGVLGPDVMIFTDEIAGDEPVLRIEPVPDNYVDLELAERRARDKASHERWMAIGGDPAGRRPSPPLKGSTCSRCGATGQVLASVQASGPWWCAFGCS